MGRQVPQVEVSRNLKQGSARARSAMSSDVTGDR